jgi:hypothetical protein
MAYDFGPMDERTALRKHCCAETQLVVCPPAHRSPNRSKR